MHYELHNFASWFAITSIHPELVILKTIVSKVIVFEGKKKFQKKKKNTTLICVKYGTSVVCLFRYATVYL